MPAGSGWVDVTVALDRFTYIPGTVSLSAPAAGAAIPNSTPTLSWTAPASSATGVTSYTTLLRATSTGVVVSQFTTTSLSLAVPYGTLSTGGAYDWNVQACNGTACSVLGPWRSFTMLGTCTSAAQSSSPAFRAKIGAPVTLTASSGGCTDPVYRFWTLPPGSSTWRIVQEYGAATQFVWGTTGKAAGVWYISVWAKSASSTNDPGTSAIISLYPACTDGL